MDARRTAGQLLGSNVVFTGRLASMSRREACQLVASEGGSVRVRVSRRTDLVVIGSDGWPLRRSGHLTANLRRAERLQEAGQRIEVLTEDAFLMRLGRRERASVRRLHTLEQLSRMIGVSGLRLRRWVRQGLLQPLDPDCVIVEFDYAEVANARMLAPLLRDARRRSLTVRSLEQLRRWLPDDRRLTDHLVRLKRQLAIRDDQGRLLDAHGQYLMRFDEQGEAVCAAAAPAGEAAPPPADERLLRAACRRHRSGDHSGAVRLYLRWLKQHGGAAPARAALVLFDLGNAFQALGHENLAARAFRRSLRRDPSHAHAWNNLGLSLAACGRLAAAVTPLRKALELKPDYCEACYNLADVLDELGRTGEARLLWMRYLAGQACGVHRDYAAQRLAELSAATAADR